MRTVTKSDASSRYFAIAIIACLAVMVLLAPGMFAATTAQAAAPASPTPGHAVAVSGDYAVAGASWVDGFRGSARVYRRSGDAWTEVQTLSPGDRRAV